MKKAIIFLCTIGMLFFGCSSKEEVVDHSGIVQLECVISGVKAPMWVCGNYSEDDRYIAVGSAPMSKLGQDFTRREALANARTNLVNDVELEVKNKIESYMNSTGIKESESIQRVVTTVSRQTSSATLRDSKQISSWESPNDGFLYVLVAVPKINLDKLLDSEVKKALDSLNEL